MAVMTQKDNSALLDLKKLSCGYGDRPVLDDVSLSVHEGEAGRLWLD